MNKANRLGERKYYHNYYHYHYPHYNPLLPLKLLLI